MRKEKKHAAVNEKRKTKKSCLFYKVLYDDNESFFCFTSSFAAQFLLFQIRMTQEISKGKLGNGK